MPALEASEDAPDGMTVIAPLSLRLRLPGGVAVTDVKPRTVDEPPSFRVTFPGAGSVKLSVFDESSWVDPLPSQRKVAYGPPVKYIQNQQIVLDEPDALIFTADSSLLGRHCTVTACSRTTPAYCVYAASGVVLAGEVQKLSDEQCRQAVALVRSLEDIR